MRLNEKNDTGKVERRSTKVMLRRVLRYGIAIFIALVLFFVLYTATVIANAPKINTGNLYSTLSEGSRLYDDAGNEIDTYSLTGGNRINLEYKEMPATLVNAVVAIEDKTFWKHKGFNIIRMFGAVSESLFSGGNISGTSTITQQLARNVYLSETKSVRSLQRKITEAWYTVILERNLTKKQIVEAYLNAIYFGNNSYGIEAASRTYFSKSAKDLNLLESAALASIPKSPDEYSLVKTLSNEYVSKNQTKLANNEILHQTSDFTTFYNGNASKDRRNATLRLMEEQGYITAKQKTDAINDKLENHINLDNAKRANRGSYFSDYIVEEVVKGLIAEGHTAENARKLIFNGGLKIHTTLNSKAQQAIEEEFQNPANFPTVKYGSSRFDSQRNIIAESGQIMLYSYSTYMPGGIFTLGSDEFTLDKDGNMTLLAGKRLSFFKTSSKEKVDYTVNFKPMYMEENRILYSIEGGVIAIPAQYKTLNNDGSLTISKKFFKDFPNVMVNKNGVYTVGSAGYKLKQKTRQPQASMVICDNKTGAIKAMIGGRDITGGFLYNRALNPRQPGSAIKPLGIYGPALQEGANAASENRDMKFTKYEATDKIEGYGKYWTAASQLNDVPMTYGGKKWPKNAFSQYEKVISMRRSVEISSNINAVRIFRQMEAAKSAEYLEKFGITSLAKTGGISDMNASALALGGMTRGISPLEMASAYTTFPNGGVHNKAFGFTEVKNKKNQTLLKSKTTSTKVLDPGVAFIVSDILRTTVTHGIAKDAAAGQVTAGKTGTTSNNFDIWFAGFTPQYSAAIWIGNDVNMELSAGSDAAARLWSKVMRKATSGMSGSLPSKPGNVVHVNGEYFIKGTEKGVSKVEEEKERFEVEACSESEFIATPWCTSRKTIEVDEDDKRKTYYCPLHNNDPATYPVEPGQKVDAIPPKNENDGGGSTTQPTPPATTP